VPQGQYEYQTPIRLPEFDEGEMLRDYFQGFLTRPETWEDNPTLTNFCTTGQIDLPSIFEVVKVSVKIETAR
jgi:hypothetical protein